MEVGEQLCVESDASWGREGSDWQSHAYAVTDGDHGRSRKSAIRNVKSSLPVGCVKSLGSK